MEEAYNLLKKRILFWRTETTLFRMTNILLFILTKVGIPLLSSLVAVSTYMKTAGRIIFTDDLITISLGIAVVVLSSLDIVFNPGNKKVVAFQRNILLSSLEVEFILKYASAPGDTEKIQVIGDTSQQLKSILSEYALSGWGK